MEGIITTENGEEKATIIYKRKADYSVDPYKSSESTKNPHENKDN